MTANPQRPEVDDPRVLALATARQQIAYESPLNFVCPPWDGLTSDEQQTSLLDARNYLHAAIAAGLVPVVSSPPATDRATVYREVADRLAADAEQGAKDGFTRIYRRSAATQVREWAEELAGGARQPDTETPACPDPIECSHEAALGQAKAAIKRVVDWTATLDAVAVEVHGPGTRHPVADHIRELLDTTAADETGEATPCSQPNPCEDGGDPCDRHEREQSHAENDHSLCDRRDCEVLRQS